MRARKRFGQNFLVDQNYIHKIVDAVHPRQEDHVVEIGPGHGALTTQIMASECHLTVVEIDRDLAAALRERFDSLEIVVADVLQVDMDNLLTEPTRLVGNLPYNISTPLLFRLFQYSDRIVDMHFMLQNEVVERMVAEPSTRAYGRLSVMTQYYCTPALLFRVPPTAFNPRPKVTSAIVRLTPRVDGPRAIDDRVMERVVADAFNQRRKTLKNALGRTIEASELEHLGIDPGSRPETLGVADYVSCANRVAELASQG